MAVVVLGVGDRRLMAEVLDAADLERDLGGDVACAGDLGAFSGEDEQRPSGRVEGDLDGVVVAFPVERAWGDAQVASARAAQAARTVTARATEPSSKWRTMLANFASSSGSGQVGPSGVVRDICAMAMPKKATANTAATMSQPVTTRP